MSFWSRLCCSEPDSPQKERRSRKVLLNYEGGGKYEGQHSEQKRNGCGKHIYPNEDQYDGQWLNDQRHGRGKMLYSNGDFYMGEWVDDRKEGRGLFVSHDMSKYEGEWKAGVMDGFGKLIDPDGSYYKGEFKAGQKDGKGTYYNVQNKKKFTNIYKAGELQTCDPQPSDRQVASIVQSSPHRDMNLNTVVLERPKVTQQDIRKYQSQNPQIKDVDLNQVINYLGIVKVKGLAFLKMHPKMWKAEHVSQWLKTVGLEDYKEVFIKNKVSGGVLEDLTEDQLKQDLNMKLGDRKRFLRAVTILHNLHKPRKKGVIKHLKQQTPFKQRSNSISSASPPNANHRSAPKPPKSIHRFVQSMKNDAIAEEMAQNQDLDDSPSARTSRRHRHQKTDKVYEPQTPIEIQKFVTEADWKPYNTLTCTNFQNHYDSMDAGDRHLHSQHGEQDPPHTGGHQHQRTELTEDLKQMQPLNLKKQQSRRIKKKDEQQNTDMPILITRKQQSKREKIKAAEKADKQSDDDEVKNGEKQDDDGESSTSSDGSASEQKIEKKRKKSREDSRPMEMRELYEYLKDHHISMNFLIPENQITNMEQIGEGGYGKVYRAKWMSNPVAVKTYVKSGRIHRKSLDDFLKQVQILNDLRHPNVVLYMGMCVQISRYSLVTQYLQHGSLFDQLHKYHTVLTTDQIFQIVEDIVLGMVYLHAKGILHRDLKSSNVLIGEDWKVKLCDFGLSVIQNSKKKKSKKKNAIIGTYQWMAPEVLRRQEDKIGFPADVYSFGMVLWELLTHQIPFKDFTPAQIQGLVGHDQTFRMQDPPDGDPILLLIMRQCLQKDPALRPSFLNILDMLKMRACPTHPINLHLAIQN